MKKAILIIFPVVVLLGIFYYIQVINKNPNDIDNIKKTPLEVKDNTIICPQCNMYLVGKKYTAQIITSDNKTHFFDDPGCSVLWLSEQKIDSKDVVMWFYTLDTEKWVKNAYFSIYDATPMHYGFGAYEQKKEDFIDFKEMRLRMLRGENMTNPKIRKKIMKGYK